MLSMMSFPFFLPFLCTPLHPDKKKLEKGDEWGEGDGGKGVRVGGAGCCVVHDVLPLLSSVPLHPHELLLTFRTLRTLRTMISAPDLADHDICSGLGGP